MVVGHACCLIGGKLAHDFHQLRFERSPSQPGSDQSRDFDLVGQHGQFPPSRATGLRCWHMP